MAKHWWVGSRSWRLAGRQSPVAAGPRRRTTGTLTAIGSTMVEPGWLDQEQHLQCLNYANYPLNLMDDSAFCAGHAQLFHERANGTRTSLWSKSKFEKQEIIFTVIQLLALVLGRSGSGWVLVSLGWIAYRLGISFKTILPLNTIYKTYHLYTLFHEQFPRFVVPETSQSKTEQWAYCHLPLTAFQLLVAG